jgi:hypothetical protein
MDFIRVLGLFSIVPATLLVTVSFFVMYLLFKVEKSGLRIFGLVVVALLWIAALVVYSTGIVMVTEGTDYYTDHGVYRSCKCPCSAMMSSGCGSMKEPYHKKMMNPHAGMMLDPDEGMMMDPHHGMMDAQSSGMPCKFMNSTQQDPTYKYHSSSDTKK